MATYIYASDELDALLKRISTAHRNGAPVPCIDTRSLIWISENKADQRRAVAACNTCPLAFQCRDYATTFKEPAGVWGGTTPKERGGNRGLPRLKNVEKRTK